MAFPSIDDPLLYRTIFDLSMDGLLIVDCDTQMILQANTRVEMLLGYPREELIGKPFTFLFPENARKPELPSKVYDGVFRIEFQKKEGSKIPLDLTVVSLVPECGILVTLRDASERVQAEEEREKLLQELQNALENIKTLRGLLPICAYCKKIRNDQGYWEQVETYIKTHSLADFTHGICPECMKKLENELNNKK